MNTTRTSRRRGTVIVLMALLMVFVLAMIAFAVDIGWIALVKSQLQVAADAGAHAGAGELGNGQTIARNKAKAIAAANIAGAKTDYVTLDDNDVTFGNWDSGSNTFVSGGSPGNAVRVTARRDALPLFFAKVIGISQWSVSATAVASVSPRDIAFVIDLSGSMNNDTEIWATSAINGAFAGYPTIGDDLLSDVYSDFGYGTYPGTLQHIGPAGSGNPNNSNSYNWLANTYLLNNASVSTTYRVNSTDSAATRKNKAYKWIIDYQLSAIMPNAKPTVNSSNLAYWSDYLDYIIDGGGSPPPSQNSYQLDGAGNPYSDAWPTLTSSSYSGFYNKVGYKTYVQFMMDYGWNKKAAGGTTYVPLSRLSADCPWRTETSPSSPGYNLAFPPREQPTHACRLAVMAAINKIKQQNAGASSTLQDHVCVISFDTASGCQIRYPLSTAGCDFDAAKASLRDMQAVADDTSSTASENGLIMARNHLDPSTNPSGPRSYSNKILIFLSDGIPNIKQSSNGTINNFTNLNTGEWFSSGSYVNERNAVLMQISQMQALGWKTYAVGIGLGADRNLMDRMARMAGTAKQNPLDPAGPRISPYANGNPADYQTRLTAIFNDIVSSKSISIVK